MRIRLLSVIALLATFTAFSHSLLAQSVNPFDASKYPDQQRQFCKVFQDFNDAEVQYSRLSPLQAAQATKPDPSQVNKRLLQLLSPSLSFTNWHGVVNSAEIKDGAVRIKFVFSCPGRTGMFELGSAFSPNTPPAFAGSGMIPFSNPLVQELTKLGHGFPATASGKLFRSSNLPNEDFADPASFRNTSLLTTGRALVSFSNVEHLLK